MRLIPVTRAAGLVLARNLPSVGPHGTPMLRAGVTITDRFQRHLLHRGIHAVWVYDDLSDGIEPVELMPEPVRRETAGRVADALTKARGAYSVRQELPLAVVDDLTAVVEMIAKNLVASPDAALAVADLASADAYTHRHSVNVTALGLLLARETFRRNGWIDYRKRRRFDRIERQLTLLGLGLLLHDIGKMAVPSDILNKPAALTPEEWEIMRGHPEAGVALLNPRLISPLVLSVVRHHHERWDGSGYPYGIVGDGISQFARIAAIADVYDAVTSERPYKAGAPPHVGVKVITEGDGTSFDSELVQVFRRVIFPYPVGTELTLTDGAIGVVVHVDPDEPEFPVLRLPDGDDAVEVRVDATDISCVVPAPAASPAAAIS